MRMEDDGCLRHNPIPSLDDSDPSDCGCLLDYRHIIKSGWSLGVTLLLMIQPLG